MVKHLTYTMTVDLPEIEEESLPSDYHVQILERELGSFVRCVAGDTGGSEGERRLLEFRVAAAILASFGAELQANVLRELIQRPPQVSQ